MSNLNDAQDAEAHLKLANVLNKIEQEGVRYVRITWVDLCNFTRYRVVPVSYFKRIIQPPSKSSSSSETTSCSDSPGGISLARAAWGLVFTSLAPGFNPGGVLPYILDPNSWRPIKYAKDQASITGWLLEENGGASPLCPRSHLRRVVKDAERQGISFLVGIETEVVFLKSTDPIEAVNNYGWSETQAISSGTPEALACEEIADALLEEGIDLQMYHSEATPGQYEFVTGALSPLESVDALVATRETIANIASKHGLRATLAPRIFMDSLGSAAHVHISIHSNKPLPPRKDERASSLAAHPLQSSFVQGILDHLPAVCAFSLPTPASYGRMLDGIWSGGTWVSWGQENRETPVRLCGNGPSNWHYEVRCHDGSANPYLSIAAMLVAGMLGVNQGKPLVAGDCGDIAPATMTAEARKNLGITTRLPLTIEDARLALKNDREMTKVFGEEFVEAYLSVNRILQQELEKDTPEKNLIKLVKTF